MLLIEVASLISVGWFLNEKVSVCEEILSIYRFHSIDKIRLVSMTLVLCEFVILLHSVGEGMG